MELKASSVTLVITVFKEPQQWCSVLLALTNHDMETLTQDVKTVLKAGSALLGRPNQQYVPS